MKSPPPHSSSQATRVKTNIPKSALAGERGEPSQKLTTKSSGMYSNGALSFVDLI
mgnify:FL=1